jgi:uncharacterized peroxidase-related enzyme
VPVLPCLPHDAGARHILGLNPSADCALIDFHSAVLRVDSQLTARNKKSITTHASGINACQYCYFVHKVTVEAFGVDEALIESLLGDLDSAPVDAGLKPVLDFARVLTLTPTQMTQRHVDAIFAASWIERDLHNAILTVCLFNFMNRLLEGHGVKGSAAVYAARRQALRDTGIFTLAGLAARGSGARDGAAVTGRRPCNCQQ